MAHHPFLGPLFSMRTTGAEVVDAEAAGFKHVAGQHLYPWKHSIPGPPVEVLLYPYLISKGINTERVNNVSKVIQLINNKSSL